MGNRSVVLNPQRRHLAENARQDWVVNAEAGTAVEDVLHPGYWAFVANEFNDFDRIEVRLESGEWIVELVVLEHDRNWARVKQLQFYDLTEGVREAPIKLESDYRVDYKGPQHLHCVIRISDSATIQSGIKTKAEAQRWLVDYEARTAVAA